MVKRARIGFKAYEELGFTDDFMFGKVMEDLELCHDVLECLFQRRIGKIIEADFQKEYKFTSDGKPIRMDLFTRTGDEVFDSEVQKLNKKSIEFLELPKRTRFYQSSIDADHMKTALDSGSNAANKASFNLLFLSVSYFRMSAAPSSVLFFMACRVKAVKLRNQLLIPPFFAILKSTIESGLFLPFWGCVKSMSIQLIEGTGHEETFQ